MATKEFREFKDRVQDYKLKNAKELKRKASEVKSWIEDGYVIKFDLLIVLKESSIFTKTKTA